MPGSPNPKSRRRSMSTRGKNWYSNRIYEHDQPFGTLVRSSPRQIIFLLSQKMSALIPHPERATALEIGPGKIPILNVLPFRKMYFMERSEALANYVNNQSIQWVPDATTQRAYTLPVLPSVREKMTVLRGDLNHLPFSSKAQVDLVVLNEVLTHISPSKRSEVVRELALRSKGMIIVDRPQEYFGDVLKKLDASERARLNELKGKRSKQAKMDRDGIKKMLNRSAYLTRDMQQSYVRMRPIVQLLIRMGWKVHPELIDGELETYMIITAKKVR